MTNTFVLVQDLWRILKKGRKLQFLIVLSLMIVSGFSEAISIASLYPVVSTFESPEKVFTIPFIGFFLNKFNLVSDKEIIATTVIIFVFFIILAAGIRIINLYSNSKFSADVGHDISCDLYESIIFLPYEEQIKLNSSQEIAALTTHISNTIIIIEKFLQTITSTLVALFIFCVLIIIQLKVTFFCIFILSISYYVISKLSRTRLINNSKKSVFFEEKLISYVQEGLGSLREIFLRSGQDFLLNKFKEKDKGLRNIKAENLLISGFPRYAIEALGVSALGFSLVYLYLLDYEKLQIISIIGTFALGAQRLLPVLQQIYYAWANIKSLSESLLTVSKKINTNKELREIKVEAIKEFSFQKRIELKNVYYKYSDDNLYALENVSLEINKGDKIGIVGKTGSGKSTLIDIIMGLIPPTKGSVLVDGKDIYLTQNRQLLNSWRNSLGHVPQSIFLLNSTISNNISFNFKSIENNKFKLNFAANISELDEFLNSKKYGFETLVGERGKNLSGGQRQRISIARAMYDNPKVLFFDEATSALDQETEKKIISNIDNLNDQKTLIMISHRLSILRNCQRIFKIDKGKIIN